MSAYEDAADEVVGDDNAPTGYPFRPLGYDAGHYYVLPQSTLQVTALPQGAITSKSYLLCIAPLEWYETHFFAKSGPDWTMAANAIIRWCERAGVFDPEVIRGRGAWYDEGRAVLHLGKRLVVDGDSVPVSGINTNYVYEARPPLELSGASEPLPPEESVKLRELCGMLNWQRPVSPVLASGWIYLAPICGALKWRPHLWVTGERGTGKSWVIDQIFRPCVGPSALIVQSTSTEAGIRQKMGQDARPILFDEAESESKRDQQRIQGVFELARQASSESSAAIAKGTAGGRAMTFKTRSMFLMGSINVTLSQAADVSRFTVCGLSRPPKGRAGTEQFERLQQAVKDTVTPQFCERLRARAYESIPTIRANAATFGKAVAEHLGDQRIGDQIGTLLAGAYGLKFDGEITLDTARHVVQKLDWSEAQESHEAASDQRRLMDELLSARVRVEGPEATVERSVAELIQATQGTRVAGVDRDSADATLQRHGLKCAGTELLVSGSHRWIRDRLADTPWSGGWSQILSYVDGSRSTGAARFAGQVQRARAVPVEWVLDSGV